MKTDGIKQKMLHRIRATGRSEETFKTYWYWCEKYIAFLRSKADQFRDPEITSRDKAESWLSSLANGKEWCSKNTQNLALQSICYHGRKQAWALPKALHQIANALSLCTSTPPSNTRFRFSPCEPMPIKSAAFSMWLPKRNVWVGIQNRLVITR